MPIAATSYHFSAAISVIGAEIMVLGMLKSDSVAAWIGMVTTVSGGLLFVVKSWRDELRRRNFQDMTDRIQALEESNREIERLRKLERERFDEAEKTFESIRTRMMAEIVLLRQTIASADSLGRSEPKP